jgi:hypothetical protein
MIVDCYEVPTKAVTHSRRCLYLDTHLTIGSIARVRTNIQATATAQVNGTASDGTTTLRKSGTARTMVREKATAKSDHSGQFFIATNKRLPCRVVAASSEKTLVERDSKMAVNQLQAEVEAEPRELFAEL